MSTCCCTSLYTCDYCSQQSAFTAPLAEVTQGSVPMVGDRNGNAKRLRQITQALLSSTESGTVKMRDGSLDDPIVLGLLQTMLDGKGALVRNGQGVLGIAVPTSDDRYLAYVGGVVQWVDVIPRTNVFTPDEFQPQIGKMVTVGCEIDGNLTLGYVDLGNSDYLYSSDGIVRGADFCDAADATSLTAVFGCNSGTIAGLKPSEGKVIKASEDGGTWIAGDESGWGLNKTFGYAISSQTGASPSIAITFDFDVVVQIQATVNTIGAPGTQQYVYIRKNGTALSASEAAIGNESYEFNISTPAYTIIECAAGNYTFDTETVGGSVEGGGFGNFMALMWFKK